jgi:hypothetical protein
MKKLRLNIIDEKLTSLKGNAKEENKAYSYTDCC